MAELINIYNPSSVIDMGGVGRLKSFIKCKVVDANIKYKIDATKLPFEDRSFDVAVSINTLEHIKQKVRFLKESIRVARKAAIHWFPFGEPAQEMEKFTKSLGHKHPCSLPNYSDHIKPFKKDPSLKCSFIPSTVSCRESLLLTATVHEKLNVEKNFEFISLYGDNPYAYILILEMKR
jgi:hypothetical protein